jgi:hypothetical protein
MAGEQKVTVANPLSLSGLSLLAACKPFGLNNFAAFSQSMG